MCVKAGANKTVYFDVGGIFGGAPLTGSVCKMIMIMIKSMITMSDNVEHPERWVQLAD